MTPNLNSFLAGALNPPQRQAPSRADRRAMREVRAEDASVPTLNSRFAPAPSREAFRHVEREHYSKRLKDRPVLDKESLAAEPLRYEVYAWFPGAKRPTKKGHRVSPKALYELKGNAIPADWMIAFADSESQRLAQRDAWEMLATGATRVEVRTYRRKAANGTRERGPVEHGLRAVMTSLSDRFIDGEPSERAIAVDRSFGC